MAASKVKGGILGIAYRLAQLVPVRKGLSPGDNALLQRVGSSPVVRIKVCRAPLQQLVGTALNLATFNKWERAVGSYGYDKIFHLYLVATLNYNGSLLKVVVEKNETVRVYEDDGRQDPNTECINVRTPFNGTLSDLLTNAQAQMGSKFWYYSAFRNNCQDFLLHILGDSELLSDRLIKFIKQDAEGIAEQLPSYSEVLADHVTGLAARLRAISGRGLGGI